MDRLPVSVIIPTYNRARLILRSLNSVLAAVEPGDEVIVGDALRFGEDISIVRRA